MSDFLAVFIFALLEVDNKHTQVEKKRVPSYLMLAKKYSQEILITWQDKFYLVDSRHACPNSDLCDLCYAHTFVLLVIYIYPYAHITSISYTHTLILLVFPIPIRLYY